VSERFWDALGNAANFAFANRLMLALMAVRGLREAVGGSGFETSLLYDAPHNLVWREELDGRPVYLHRKGACPARGFGAMAGTPFEYYGEPVLVPGSMGSSSFVLAGRGNPDALWSASHGAGRALSRGDALRASDEAFRRFMREFRVVTPVDLRRPDVKLRRDIVEKKLDDIKKEAPFAYKGIGPIVNTLADAGIARPVAELTPLMTSVMWSRPARSAALCSAGVWLARVRHFALTGRACRACRRLQSNGRGGGSRRPPLDAPTLGSARQGHAQ
jgi:tRNA-splicing ligase RtcB